MKPLHNRKVILTTASLVTYNTPIKQIEMIIKCYKPAHNRILFIINNSAPPAPKITSDCRYITITQNPENIGYGAAHNIAINRSIAISADYHIILNPDLIFTSESIGKIEDYAEKNEDVSYILPKVIYPNGEIQYLCKRLPMPSDLFFRRFLPKTIFTEKINDRYLLKRSGYNKIINPPCLSGCFMFLRVKTLKEKNLKFDEHFFMYLEDFDFIRRIHRIAKTVFYPEVTIIHDHAKESYKNLTLLKEHIKSAIYYFNKYGWFIDPERTAMNIEIEREIDALDV